MQQSKTKIMWVVASGEFPVKVITEAGGTSGKIRDAQQFPSREEAEKRRQDLERPEEWLTAELTVTDRFEFCNYVGSNYELDARHKDNPPSEWLVYGSPIPMKSVTTTAELGEIKGGEDV